MPRRGNPPVRGLDLAWTAQAAVSLVLVRRKAVAMSPSHTPAERRKRKKKTKRKPSKRSFMDGTLYVTESSAAMVTPNILKHNYMRILSDAVEEGRWHSHRPDGTPRICDQLVQHDKWCDALTVGGFCNCAPILTITDLDSGEQWVLGV